MTGDRSIASRPRVVGVVASYNDLERAVRLRKPPHLFELRLDSLAHIADRVENLLPRLRAPLIITARIASEGGGRVLGPRQRRDLLARFLHHADYIDVELRSAPALQPLLSLAKNSNVQRIISFHDFRRTPSVQTLSAKAHEAKSHGADIFKVATRTETPIDLGRLLQLMTRNRWNLPLAVMGIGKLGAISRVLLARAGSTLIYGSVGSVSHVEGQMSLEQLRTFGFGH